MFVLINFCIGKTEFVYGLLLISINFGRIGDILLDLIVGIDRFMGGDELHFDLVF